MSAQSQTRYQVLQSSGPIPADFLRSAQTKYQAELEQWADSSEEIQESARRFLQEDYYYLNQLLRSGQLLFGDPLTQYLNRLTDHILRFRPEIRAQLRVYTVKSSIANAASTYDGIIFVNMGLLARVENEAQLAFVLSHEISHFVERHTLKSYLKYEQKERSAGRKKDFEALQNVHYRYSRQLELRADSLGLQLYLEAGYRPEAIAEVFAILEIQL
ncbi:MAG: M48 family metallopeptidase [Bacteroidota bacterium]